MNGNRQGWTILIFLVVISLLVLLATNGFKIASTMVSGARMRYRYHQELYLVEGLLTCGKAICNDNRALLMAWGAEKSQTMALHFDPWPSQSTITAMGAYKGLLTITSQKGSLYLNAQLTKNNNQVMNGQCTLKSKDTKQPQGQLVVTYWNIKPGG